MCGLFNLYCLYCTACWYHDPVYEVVMKYSMGVISFISSDLLRFDSMNADAIYVRGLCLYYQDNVDKAFQHFQQVLRFAPDHTKARNIYRVRADNFTP